jgi:hypothetical protein
MDEDADGVSEVQPVDGPGIGAGVGGDVAVGVDFFRGRYRQDWSGRQPCSIGGTHGQRAVAMQGHGEPTVVDQLMVAAAQQHQVGEISRATV